MGHGELRADQDTAVILLNLGGPENLDQVEPYLVRLFSDRKLIRLPGGPWLQKPLARLLARRRAVKSRRYYEQIGGGSPLRYWSERQATALQQELGEGWRTYILMRYADPRAQQVVQCLQQDGIRQALVLPLYPQFAEATSGSGIDDFQRAVSELFPELAYTVVPHWYDWPPYLDALAARVREGLEHFAKEHRDQVPLLFSAHAMPQKVIDRGDPYLSHVLATARGLLQRFTGREWYLGFQSRSGPVRWTGPALTTLLDQLSRAGQKDVLLVPLSFVSDHVETVYEIDRELQQEARRRGISNMVRCPALNDHRDFITALAVLVRHHRDLAIEKAATLRQ